MNGIYAVFDLETTGGSPKQERIIEIAIVKFDGEKILDKYETLINPEKNIPPFVARLTGITNQMVKDAPLFKDVIIEVKNFLKGCILVAHNAKSDYGFLKTEFKTESHHFQMHKICTIKLASKVYPDLEKYNLPYLSKKFNINPGDSHRAMADAVATTHLFKHFLNNADDDLLTEFFDLSESKNFNKLKISKKAINEIPEETGVILFYDKDNQLMYISRSLDMNEAIADLMFNYNANSNKGNMLKHVEHINFVSTGSELLASLLEIDYTFKYKPKFSKKHYNVSRITKLQFHENKDGYEQILIFPAKLSDTSIYKFGNKYNAIKTVEGLVKKYKLCQNLMINPTENTKAHCEHFENNYCNGACLKKEEVKVYNKRVKKAIKSLNFKEKYMIVDEGPDISKKTILKIENNVCLGYNFIDSAQTISVENLEIIPLIGLTNHPAIMNTINKFIANKRVEVVL